LHVETVDEQHRGAQQEHAELKRADGVRVDDLGNVDGSRHMRAACVVGISAEVPKS
jgi:hypothetical protein